MKTLIRNAKIINENKIIVGDVLIEEDSIKTIGKNLPTADIDRIIEGEGQYLMPGVIDDQVHFREPGLTHKATIETESRAAVAGGVTSYIDQPNTVPNAVTQELLEVKYKLAENNSFANYSFSMGGTNDNLEEVLKTNPKNVAAVKLFLGSSTGNMLVDDPETLEYIFSKVKMPICVHCEDESTIIKNTQLYKDKYGDDIPVKYHHLIRSEEACYTSSSKAIALAKKTGARLHLYHISTAKETELFRNDIPLKDKKITAEVCVNHLWFTDADYETKGAFIKWNPAVKTQKDKDGLWEALLDDRIDVVATDHAPHTIEEKKNPYTQCPSGAPLVQHSLQVMLEAHRLGKISLEKIVEKMCHNPAILFQIEKRGFIREGYKADLVLVDLDQSQSVTKGTLFYKCGWSPLEGEVFHSTVTHTFVNGHLAYENGKISEERHGKRLSFER
ncbi:dihydroorotase [Riemerella columbipharyngis]|uniref:Dihydroorotase n=1 Tax=Riemerella columbipharyngis TaxID=1071918 RepID=A0A1G7CU59_9FLAO|nr:dihydroorotase [Riemerella columbipharyngis]SDE42837.1 dihydroorotase [Riemerella columbipharyngis]